MPARAVPAPRVTARAGAWYAGRWCAGAAVNSVEALCKSLCKAEEDWATKHADAKAERRPGLVKQIDVSHAWYKMEEVRIDKEAQAQLEGFMKTEAAKYA